jgi:hypothetical protein
LFDPMPDSHQIERKAAIAVLARGEGWGFREGWGF